MLGFGPTSKVFFFANLKKYYFYQDKFCFLGYIVLLKKISIKAKRIKVIKDWFKPKSVYNIQVFLGFANFYQQFIQSFSRIIVSLTLILKTIILLEKSTSKQLKVYDDKMDRFDIGSNKELAKKLEKSKSQKLSRLRKSKSKKLAKSRKPSKNEDLSKFVTKKI